MLKKLRNKLLIICMSVTLLTLFLAFCAVYITTSEKIKSDNALNLSNAVAATRVRISEQSSGSSEKTYTVNDNQAISQTGNYPVFTVVCDNAGNVLEKGSALDISDETYTVAAIVAMNNKIDSKQIEIDDKIWMFEKVAYSVMENGGDDKASPQTAKMQITFLDITETANVLNGLLLTFGIVGLAMIVVIFVMSMYFANRAITPVKTAIEKQRQFVADASHELKTPLAVLTSTYSALQANEDETIKSQSEFFGYMKSGMDKMAKLINELLSLARMENTSRMITCAPFDIGAEVEKATRKFETLIREKSVAFSCSIEPDVVIASDQTLAIQAFEILFDNAVKYVNEDGKIDVTLKKEKHVVICTIGNSGEGIDKADLSKIFDRFYRADRSRSSETGGYGLGLAIAKSIMDSLGGKIEATSENEWTVFKLII